MKYGVTASHAKYANVINVYAISLSRNVRKRTFEHVRPAKIQIRLRIRTVWSESSLGAFWIAKDAVSPLVENEESD